jgi:hypothetical protein
MFRIDRRLGRGIRLRAAETVSSSRLEIRPSENKWKDQHQMVLRMEKELHPLWLGSLIATDQLFSDNQAFLEGTSASMSNIRIHSLEAELRFRKAFMAMPAGFGPKQDHRFGRTDNGLRYWAGLDVPAVDFAGYELSVDGNAQTDDLGRRRNEDLGLHAGVRRVFEEGVADSLQARWNRQRRDYYMSAEGDIESRSEQGREIANALTYRLSRALGLRVVGSLSARDLAIHSIVSSRRDKQRERRDFHAAGSAAMWFRSATFSAGLLVSQTGEEQNYWIAENRRLSPYFGASYTNAPDNRSRLTTLSLRTAWRFTASDSLLLFSSLQRLRYDTPDLENVDDRDELRFWMDIQERHSFTDRLELRVGLSAHLFHQVYISGRKSADNNTVRILRFTPSLRWSLSERVRFSQSAEVLANYVEYDFEAMFPGIRSFLYRKFRIEDSVWVSLTPGIGLLLYGRFELDENGKFLWDRWLEQRLVDRKSHNVSVQLDIRPMAGMHLMPGYTVYSRKGYGYTESPLPGIKGPGKDLNLLFLNRGPTLKLAYTGDRLVAALTAGTTWTKTLQVSRQQLTRLDLTLSWRL